MLEIEAIAAFTDNYIWMLVNRQLQRAVIVDPGDATPVLTTLESQQLTLDAILLTHHHHDHTGGTSKLLKTFPSTPTYAYKASNHTKATHPVNHNDTVTLLNGTLALKVLHIPGHTLDHIAFLDDTMLFCGDTLFSAGCGRAFEGSPAQLFQSLQSLTKLPQQTKVYCGHEYTSANLQFAATVEPDNKAITERALAVKTLRKKGLPSLPSTIALEQQTNPFLRTSEPTVIASAEQQCGHTLHGNVDVFTVLRNWKDRF